MVKKVAPDLFMITQTAKGRFIKFSVNVFIIGGVDGLIFDAGYGKRKANNYLAAQIKQIEKEMRDNGRECNITSILPSHGHWDHFSGVTKLRDKLGVTVLATKRMLKSIGSKKNYIESYQNANELIELPSSAFRKSLRKTSNLLLNELIMVLLGVNFVTGPLKLVGENSTIFINKKPWKIILLPGHCDDAIVLYNRKDGILLCGDNILRSVTTWLGPPKSDLKAYIRSLEYLLTLPDLKLILPAHGSPITEPVKRIKETINHRHQRTKEMRVIISQTGNAGISFDEIFKKFYPTVKFYEKYILTGWILTTLEYLIQKKEIVSFIEEKRKKFRAYASTEIISSNLI